MFASNYSLYYKDTKEVSVPTGTITYNSPSLTTLNTSVAKTSSEHTNQMMYLSRVNDYIQALNPILNLNFNTLSTNTITDQDVSTYENVYNALSEISKISVGSGTYLNIDLT